MPHRKDIDSDAVKHETKKSGQNASGDQLLLALIAKLSKETNAQA
jgi:hypothetical protein